MQSWNYTYVLGAPFPPFFRLCWAFSFGYCTNKLVFWVGFLMRFGNLETKVVRILQMSQRLEDFSHHLSPCKANLLCRLLIEDLKMQELGRENSSKQENISLLGIIHLIAWAYHFRLQSTFNEVHRESLFF